MTAADASAFDRLWDRLEAVTGHPPTGASTQWKARCPAHDDRDPSLAIGIIEDGAVIYCHAGCDTDAVLAALDLDRRDLYDAPRQPRRDVAATYQYTGMDGQPTRTVHRIERPDGKTFRQQVTDKAAPALYRLPELVAAVAAGHTVYVVEGEKDVHAVESVGGVATCSAMGAGKWRPEYAEHFQGARVVIVADKDTPGRKHAAQVAGTLFDVAYSVRVAEAVEGKDAADHIAAGHTLDDLATIPLERLMPPTPPRPAQRGDEERTPTRTVRLTPASKIRPLPVRWVWDNRIPTGAITLIPGREGIGKSLTLVWITARMTRGELPGEHQGTPRAVLYAATEDSWERTIVPRLIAAGADLDLVYRVDVVVADDGVDALSLPRDCRALRAEVERLDGALVCIDPLMSSIGAGIDTHHDRELRTALEPLVRVADRTGCAIAGLAHFNKSASTDPLTLVSGSRAFTAVVRAAIGVARDEDADDGSCVLTQVKNNLGRLDLPSLRYVIDDATVDTDEGPARVGRLRFIGESSRSVYDILRDGGDGGADRMERDEAVAWLRGYLADQGGEASPTDTKKAGTAAGFSQRTIERIRPKAGVKTQRHGFGPGAKYVWSLDLDVSPPHHACHARGDP